MGLRFGNDIWERNGVFIGMAGNQYILGRQIADWCLVRCLIILRHSNTKYCELSDWLLGLILLVIQSTILLTQGIYTFKAVLWSSNRRINLT